jgi:hypothetical protein
MTTISILTAEQAGLPQRPVEADEFPRAHA